MPLSIQDLERELGIPRWRIDHAIKFHQVCQPERFGHVRSFCQEDLRKLAVHFNQEMEAKNEQ